MTFAITPVTGFPAEEQSEFPGFVQWQWEGVDQGDNRVAVVNFVGDNIQATRGTGEHANVITVRLLGADPSFANVAYILHFDDIAAPTVFTDVQGNVWSKTGVVGGELDQRNSIGQPAKFPPACGYFGNNTGGNPNIFFDYPTLPLDDSGLNRFTLECWMVPGPFGVLGMGFTTSLGGGQDMLLTVQNRSPVRVTGAFSTGAFSVGGGSLPGGVFSFLEANYDGSYLRVFINGVMVAKGAAAPGTPLTFTRGKVGMFSASPGDYMYIDDCRFTFGVCRHPSDATYSVPTRAFPNF